MTLSCEHNIPETKKGTGPCDIRWEVKKRNGKPNWWCRTHGLDASTPAGAPLDECSGSWFEPVTDTMQLEVDLDAGPMAIWGALPPAVTIGKVLAEPGKVHVHHRSAADSEKDIDRSYDIVRVTRGDKVVVVEGMAAQAYSLSELASEKVVPLACPHCGEVHIDELEFATRGHTKHLCNSCGRNFRNRELTISNPLADAQERLGLPAPQAPCPVQRPLVLVSSEYSGIALWPANRSIVSTMGRPEDDGVHVHAWDQDGHLVRDETYSTVVIDGREVNQDHLRHLAIQRATARRRTPIVAMDCETCHQPVLSPTDDWMRPTTRHRCQGCGAESRTRRKSFVNPLADLGG